MLNIYSLRVAYKIPKIILKYRLKSSNQECTQLGYYMSAVDCAQIKVLC